MIVYAHRGASGYAPENTKAAFLKAIEMGAKAIELDVQLSKDGQVIVAHDDTVDRLSKEKGVYSQFSVSELRQIDVGSWMDVQFKKEYTPTLEEVLRIIPETIKLNIEIKHMGFRLDVVKKTHEVLRKANRKNCVISSFNHLYIWLFMQLEKKYLKKQVLNKVAYPLALLYETDHFKTQLHLRLWTKKIKSINIAMEDISINNVQLLHKLGYEVLVYTVNERENATYLECIGVDGIFSNYPEIMSALEK